MSLTIDQSGAATICRKNLREVHLTAGILPAEKRRRLLAIAAALHTIRTTIQAGYLDGGKDLQQRMLGITAELNAIFANPRESESAIGQTFAELNLGPAPLLSYIDAWNLVFVRRGFRDETQLRQYLRGMAVPVSLSARVLSASDDELATIGCFGEAAERLRILAELSQDIGKGRLFFSEVESQATALNVQDLIQGKATDGFRDIAQRWIGEIRRARQAVSPITATFPKDGSRRFASIWVAWFDALLERVARDPERLPREAVALKSMEKAGIALRAGLRGSG